jgi:hypothetical protein
MTYVLINHVEEIMEMTGSIIFIYALLLYIRANRLAAVVRVVDRRKPDRQQRAVARVAEHRRW